VLFSILPIFVGNSILSRIIDVAKVGTGNIVLQRVSAKLHESEMAHQRAFGGRRCETKSC
jgi:hypothetical protein